MASSQVEIASSAPFGCVLRDHNRRERCREGNARAAHANFEKNLKDLVRDHLHSCISISSGSDDADNSHNQTNNIDSWVHNEQRNNHPKLRYTTHNLNNKEESSSLSQRQSEHLDRWAARKARDMVSSIEKQSNEAVLSANSSKASNFKSDNSSVQSEVSSEATNLGASSLVQIWEARSNSTNMNTSRSNSGLSNIETISSIEEPLRASEVSDFADERTIEDGRPNNEDSFPDWESAHSDQHSTSQCGNSDGGESERVRVADIIRRLTCEYDQEHANPNERVREKSPGSDQGEHKVVSSPRLRGRQAFADLLMQLERDRHKELDNLVQRRAVSRFPQRGRIQSLLRLRFLQRGMVVQDQQRQQPPASGANRARQGSTIMHLREIFKAGIEQGVAARTVAANRRGPREERANSTLHPDNSSSPTWLQEDNHRQEVINTNEERSKSPVQHSPPCTSEEFLKEASPSADVSCQGTSLEASNIGLQETEDTSPASASETSDVIWRGTSLETSNLDLHETAETTVSLNDWDDNEMEEEPEVSDQQFIETNYDWASDISRPRSYWESLRKEWYQEMLNNNSNNEICQLLERGTVSTFLSGEFREKMDQLMASRLQRQTHVEGSQEEEEAMMSFLQRHTHPVGIQAEEDQEQAENEVEEVDGEESAVEEEEEEQHEVSNRERMYQLMSFLQRRTHPVGSLAEEEEEQEGNEVHQEEEEEEGSLIGHQFHEASNYFDQTTSPSTFRSWNCRDHDEVGDDLDQAASTSSQLPSPNYYRDTRPSSVEMEYDLRGHMEQLYREMAELRKSIKSCMEMQLELQNSMKQEVLLRREGKKKSHDRTPWKGNCCICYEMKVDSLLYRCGHMCTCIKCAYELQWSSGKCPICRAPIEDVVRAYAHS